MKKKLKLFDKIALSLACLLGLGALATSLNAREKEPVKVEAAATTTLYSHTFAAGDFRTDRWWGVDGDVFWADSVGSIESDGCTFNVSEYLRRFVYENSAGNKVDNVFIPVHFTGDALIRVVNDEDNSLIRTAYFQAGDNAINLTALNTTAKKIAVNVNRRYSTTTPARILYGETVVISKQNEIEVTLNANGGSGGSSKITCIPDSAMPTVSSLPTRTGYTFQGFFDDPSGGTKYINANGSSAKNYPGETLKTLYAHWSANTYTVSYNANKPSNATGTVSGVPGSATWTYDSNATLGSAPTLTGWTFGGWYKESGCTNKVGNAGATLTKPNLRSTSGTVTLYAKWTANTYTVAYNANKPENATASVVNVPANATWTYDSNATLASAPSLTGWTFGGWYADAACTNKIGNAGATLTKPNLRNSSGTVNLYAKWIPNTYTVSYNANKPEHAPTEVQGMPENEVWTYDNNSEVTLGNAPTLTGYDFLGWYAEAACANKVGDAEQSLLKPNLSATNNSTVNLYAKWKFNAAVQAVVDEINETKTVDYDDLTSQIAAADDAYNNLPQELKDVIDSEGYKDILDNAHAADDVAKLIEGLGQAENTNEWKNRVGDVRDAYEDLVDKSFIPVDTIISILEDDEAAVIVMNLINDIGNARWTPSSKTLIDTAQAGYDSYIANEHPHAQIANYDALVQANTDYDNVQTFVDKVEAITANPFEYTAECKALIDEARRYFEEDLSDYQKGLAREDAATYYDLLVNYENAYNAMHLIDEINDMENKAECGEKIETAREAIDALDVNEELTLVREDLLKELTDKEAAWEVMGLINDIYPMVYGKDCEDAIQAAREAYDALKEDQKPLVVNYGLLTKAEEDYAADKAVVEQVAALGDIRYDEESLEKIEAAREAYENLTEDQKAFYPAESLKTIVDYETAYDALEKIYNVGKVGYDSDSEGKIDDAREFYDSLSDEQKLLINREDLNVLITSENEFASMKQTATVWVIILLILACLALIAGCWFLFVLIMKRIKNDEDDNGDKKEPVKAMSVVGVLPFTIMTSHYLGAPWVALYIIAGLAFCVWAANLVLWLLERKKNAEAIAEAPAAVQEEAASNEEEEVVTVNDGQGNIFQIRFIKSFEAKLIQAPEETKKYHEELKNYVLTYRKTTSRVSWHYDSINSGRNPVLKFAIRGKTLGVYLPLNPDEYAETKYKVEKIESKRFEDVPCLYRIKNDRRLGYAKDLIDTVCEKLGLVKGEEQHEAYANRPYEANKPLVARGLIKEQKVQINKPKETVLESHVNAEGDEVITTKDENGNIFQIRFVKSFTAKLSQADETAKNYYNIIKNHALSYKKANSRISWRFDSINVGRDKVLRFAFRGKTLCVYFALDEVESKYKVEKVESKKYEETPRSSTASRTRTRRSRRNSVRSR